MICAGPSQGLRGSYKNGSPPNSLDFKPQVLLRNRSPNPKQRKKPQEGEMIEDDEFADFEKHDNAREPSIRGH